MEDTFGIRGVDTNSLCEFDYTTSESDETLTDIAKFTDIEFIKAYKTNPKLALSGYFNVYDYHLWTSDTLANIAYVARYGSDEGERNAARVAIGKYMQWYHTRS